MPARRCSIGCESWPDHEDFKVCIVCGEPTRRVGNIKPTVDDEEAKRLLSEARFEAWCVENDRT